MLFLFFVCFFVQLKLLWGLSMVPLIKFRRVVANGSPHLSAADDSTSFMTLFCFYELCLEHVLMRLSMVPSIRSRRVASNGGPHLFVACL